MSIVKVKNNMKEYKYHSEKFGIARLASFRKEFMARRKDGKILATSEEIFEFYKCLQPQEKIYVRVDGTDYLMCGGAALIPTGKVDNDIPSWVEQPKKNRHT